MDFAYVRLQAERCQRLSRSCMDLGTARDLRLMADEYFEKAARIEAGVLEGSTSWNGNNGSVET
jgi:hypothetical protein